MKKLVMLFVVGAMIFASEVKAQGFYTSFGFEQSWGMPSPVYWSLDRHFSDYHMVHSRRFWDDGRLFFDVVLQRGNVFVNVNIGSGGYIFNQVYFNNYPFAHHVCNSFCGFHSNYYMNYRVTCTSHNHFGHNHVVYNPVIVYKWYPDAHHHGYNNGYHHGYAQGYKQGQINDHHDHHPDVSRGGRGQVVNNDPIRGRGSNDQDGSHGNNGNNGVRDHGAGVGRGNGNGQGNGNNNGNNGVRDHGIGVGRGNGNGNGQGGGNGNGNSGRIASPPIRTAPANTVRRTASQVTYRSNTSATRTSSNARTSSNTRTTSSGRGSTSGRTVATRTR